MWIVSCTPQILHTDHDDGELAAEEKSDDDKNEDKMSEVMGEHDDMQGMCGH